MERDRDILYEQLLGIRTELEQTDYAGGDYFAFQSTGYSSLEKIFDALHITEYDTLVDFGCGLGRVLFFVSHRYRCRVTGVEYEPELFEQLKDNEAYYHVRFGGQREKFTLLNMRAEDYRVGQEDNYFYLFNPFAKEILITIIRNILASVEEHPRKIYIIFYYCTPEYIETMRQFPLRLSKAMRMNAYFLDPDEKCYIYTNE